MDVIIEIFSLIIGLTLILILFGFIVILILGVLFFLIVLTYRIYLAIVNRLEINKQVTHLYQAARGTQHRILLDRSLKSMRKIMQSKKQTHNDLINSYNKLKGQEDREIEDSLTRYLIEFHLPKEVSGVGHKTVGLILIYVYRNSLTDLYNASKKVPKIGQLRQLAIDNWVNSTRKRWPEIRIIEFPQKQEIQKRYNDERLNYAQEIEKTQKELDELVKYHDHAEAALIPLQKISKTHFKEIFSSTNHNTEALAKYIQGVFPEWEEIPEWFSEIIQYSES